MNFNKDIIRKIILYSAVFINGATVLIIEILGTRILAPFYGSTIFVWSSLITATMAFLALGYSLGGWLADKRPKTSWFYVIIFLAGLAVSFIPKIDQPILLFSDQFGLRFGPLVASLILFALPLLLAGMVSPFAIRLTSKFIEKSGTAAGRIFAVGTVGSLIGGLAAGFFLIPLMPLTQIFYITAAILVVLALIGLVVNKDFNNKKMLIILILLATATVVAPSFDIKTERSRIIYHATSFYGDMKLVKAGSYTCLYIDAGGQSCITKDFTTDSVYVKEINDLIEANSFDKILLLGMGSGSVLTAIPDGVELDIVELDPAVVKVSEDFNLIPDKEYSLYYDDARHFLRKSTSVYDFIIVDLTRGASFPPYMFTKESFLSIKDRLSESGVVFVRLSFNVDADNRLYSAIWRTLREVFGDNVLVVAPDERRISTLNFIASQERLDLNNILYEVEPDTIGLTAANLVLSDNFNPIENTAFVFFKEIRESTKAHGLNVLFSN